MTDATAFFEKWNLMASLSISSKPADDSEVLSKDASSFDEVPAVPGNDRNLWEE